MVNWQFHPSVHLTPATMLVACNQHRVIGYKGKIPWYIPEDLKFFKTVTLTNIVIMGRKTFQSLTKPLLKRHLIVLTSQIHPYDTFMNCPAIWPNDKVVDGYGSTVSFYPNSQLAVIKADVINSSDVLMPKRYALIKKDANFIQTKPQKKIIIAGGEQVYREWLNYPALTTIIITQVFDNSKTDTHFPELSDEWKLSVSYTYKTHKRFFYYKHRGYQ